MNCRNILSSICSLLLCGLITFFILSNPTQDLQMYYFSFFANVISLFTLIYYIQMGNFNDLVSILCFTSGIWFIALSVILGSLTMSHHDLYFYYMISLQFIILFVSPYVLIYFACKFHRNRSEFDSIV